ncbi:MAG: hypothetical protein V4631_09470 [Pseudomonadota bacterium]
MNPLKYKCPSCAAVLTVGRTGKMLLVIACLLGLTIAGVAIVMEERGEWSRYGTLLWFAISVPTILLPFQWICWKYAVFVLKK